MYFQDIARLENKFFYHPIGGEGLFEYDINTKAVTELMRYSSGDHIAADSIFVFVDFGHTSIMRYDVTLDSAVLLIRYSQTGNNIFGMDVYNGSLYVLAGIPQQYQLRKYNFDGILEDSLTYSKTTYYITIHNGVLYSVDYNSGTKLSRFDLKTRVFLSDILAPARFGDGIKVYQSYFYFVDTFKQVVGRVPLAEILGDIPVASDAPVLQEDRRRDSKTWRE